MAKNRFRQVSAHGKSRQSFVVKKSGSPPDADESAVFTKTI
jgi:hypothetical protein